MTAFGALSVAAMLLFYALDERWSQARLAFAAACWTSAAYAWLAGAWPFTFIEAVWGLVALRRYVATRGSSAPS